MKNTFYAFTLAEVLITLIIIGVVAAITVPILRNDTADKKWNVARQKAQATIGEAFRLMTVNGEIGTDKTTEQFANKVIPKYLKIERTCLYDKYGDCGFSSKVKKVDGKAVTIAPSDWKWTNLSPTSRVAKNNITSVGGWNSANVDTITNVYGGGRNGNMIILIFSEP